MPKLDTSSSLMEFAAAVTEALMAHDIAAVLSGGHGSIGFSPEMNVNPKEFVGRHLTHPAVEWVIEFPTAPIAFGETEIQVRHP